MPGGVLSPPARARTEFSYPRIDVAETKNEDYATDWAEDHDAEDSDAEEVESGVEGAPRLLSLSPSNVVPLPCSYGPVPSR